MSQQTIVPFLRWPGGKRWLIEQHPNLFPKTFNAYCEPFLGSGAVFFYLNPERAILSDSNAALIETFSAIRNSWRKVISELEKHQELHSVDYYYYIRDTTPTSRHERAARFIYLNRTCFNGIYRVNRNGEFNVPVGDKKNVILESDNWREVSLALRPANLISCDFEAALDMTREGDFAFIDPPYTVKHNANNFVKYNENLFSWQDQVRLNKSIRKALCRGVKILMLNAAHDCIRDLYSGQGTITAVARHSVIASSSRFRGLYDEIVFSAN